MTENKMGIAPINRLILGMSWPAMLSMFINAIYSIVDSIFVSYLGEGALVAVTLVLPVQLMLVAFGVGTGVGINSVIARKLGEKNQQEADIAANCGIYLQLINYIVFASFGLIFANTFIGHFTGDDYIFTNGIYYLRIVTLGSVFVIFVMGFEKILQATGDMIHPMIFMLLGAGLNIIMDPIMIFGLWGFPKLGVPGAAIATVLAQMISFLYAVYVIKFKEHLVKIDIRKYKLNRKIVKEIYGVGLPAIVTQAVSSLTVILLNSALAMYSTTAVAVLGVYARLERFIFMPLFGIRQGAMPIMGYNYGARNKERVMSALKISLLYGIIIAIIGMSLFNLLPEQLLLLFNAKGDMMSLGILALKTISLCFIPAAFGIITSALYQAIGHGFLVLIGSFIRQIIVIIPFAYLLLKLGGTEIVWYAFPIAEIFGVIFYGITLYIIYKKEIAVL
jgi:putative MATE family efflux protein